MSTLTITTIQTNLHWEDKAANLQLIEQKIRSIQERTEIVILPEMFSTGFSMQPEKLAEKMDGTTVAWMKNLSAEKKVILTGSLIIEEEGHYYNRLIWMLPNGQYGFYDKRHLFAYAHEDQHYTPGNKRLIASVKGWKVNLQVCYDLRFPVWSRQQQSVPTVSATGEGDHLHPLLAAGTDNTDKTPEYDLLIYVANWPERRNHAWKTLLQARAIENQCYVVGVNRVGVDGKNNNYTGDSSVFGPLGEKIWQQSVDVTCHTVTLEKEALQKVRTGLPFLNDADKFLLL